MKMNSKKYRLNYLKINAPKLHRIHKFKNCNINISIFGNESLESEKN